MHRVTGSDSGFYRSQPRLYSGPRTVFVRFANLPVTAYPDNPLAASVEQFACRMGEKAAETLLHVMDNPPLPGMAIPDILIETRLIVPG